MKQKLNKKRSAKNITASKQNPIKVKKKNSKVKKVKIVLTPQKKEQLKQIKDTRALLSNISFIKCPDVDNIHFEFNGRDTELDDIFYFENIILLTEYTVGDTGTHLLKKKIIYDLINKDSRAFINHLLNEPRFNKLKKVFNDQILNTYSINQLQVKILYVSLKEITDNHKNIVKNIKCFEYSHFKYFESIAKIIKRSSRFEFFDYLNIPFDKIGENILQAPTIVNEFSAHILPEEHSSFKEGYKIISFYMDAESLIKRAYVLRNDSWRNSENIGFYQRMFVEDKIKKMRKYLHTEKRVFINNIIVTLPVDKIKVFDIDKKNLELDENGNFKISGITKVKQAYLAINDEPNIIGIIDGQHRTFAYHEDVDSFENSIKRLRKVQNLLITGILFPSGSPQSEKIKFESKLFLEINSTQSKAKTKLIQEIESIMDPLSTIAISKSAIKYLNKSVFNSLLEDYWFEKNKLKTSSFISFGLKPLMKMDSNDSLFSYWNEAAKKQLIKDSNHLQSIEEYKEFCFLELKNIFLGFKLNLSKKSKWSLSNSSNIGVLNVTTIIGITICLRLIITSKKRYTETQYLDLLKNIDEFDFKLYKSSQYFRMGEDLFKNIF